MEEFEQWYLDTYYKPYGFVPPANLFERYEDTYIRENVYQHNLVWQHLQAKVEELQTLYTQQGINMLKLQKRVDAVKGLIEDLNKCYQQDHQNKFEYWRGFADSAGILGKRLEQALKGEKE